VSCGTASENDKGTSSDAPDSPLKLKALAGDRDAQFKFGNSFCCGSGAGLDTAEAIRWWCLAAIQDHPGALAALKKHDPRKTCPI
jgi:TPR repeat protein